MNVGINIYALIALPFELLMNMSYRISKEEFNMRFHTQIIILLCLFGIKACPSRKRWKGITRTTTLKTTPYIQVYSFYPRTTDTQRLNPYFLRPKFKSQSQINIWDVDINND